MKLFSIAIGLIIFMSEVGERLAQEVEHLGGVSAVSNLLGVTRNTVYNWIEKGNMGLDKLLQLGEAGGDVNFILANVRSKPRDPAIQQENNAAYNVEGGEFAYVDFLDVEASAGGGATVGEERVVGKLAFRRDWLRAKGLQAGRLRLLTARGDSMGSTVPDGAILLVDKLDDAQGSLKDGIYVLRWDGGLIVKRLQRGFDGSYEIISDNPAYRSQHVPADRVGELHVIGRVAWIGHEI